jgi:hypothetical protein
VKDGQSEKVGEELRGNVGRHSVEEVEGDHHENLLDESKSTVARQDQTETHPKSRPQSKEVLRVDVVRLIERQQPANDTQRREQRPNGADSEAELEVATKAHPLVPAGHAADTVHGHDEEDCVRRRVNTKKEEGRGKAGKQRKRRTEGSRKGENGRTAE